MTTIKQDSLWEKEIIDNVAKVQTTLDVQQDSLDKKDGKWLSDSNLLAEQEKK